MGKRKANPTLNTRVVGLLADDLTAVTTAVDRADSDTTLGYVIIGTVGAKLVDDVFSYHSDPLSLDIRVPGKTRQFYL